MKFAAPHVLKWLPLFAPLILVLAGLHRRRRRRLASLIASPAWATVIPGYDARRAARRTALRVGALALIGLAIARPQWGVSWREVRQRGLDIVVVLDTSKSMLASDLRPNRLQQAKWAVRDFLRTLEGDRVGLVAFAGSSFLQCPITVDYAAFTMMLDDLYAGIIPRGGTAIEQALQTAVDSFDEHDSSDRVILLITDGEDHEGDPLQMIESLKEKKIRLYSIGVGTPAGELIPTQGGGYLKDRRGQIVKSAINEPLLEQLARETGGFYVRAAAGDFGLDRVYELGLSALQRSEQETRLAKIYDEHFALFSIGAILLLLAEALLTGKKQ